MSSVSCCAVGGLALPLLLCLVCRTRAACVRCAKTNSLCSLCLIIVLAPDFLTSASNTAVVSKREKRDSCCCNSSLMHQQASTKLSVESRAAGCARNQQLTAAVLLQKTLAILSEISCRSVSRAFLAKSSSGVFVHAGSRPRKAVQKMDPSE